MNLIVTCPRKYEEDAKQEIEKILNDLGDTNPEINILYMPGILTLDTQVEYSKISESITKKINDEPWSLRYCLRIIPVQSFSETKIEEIIHSLMELTNVIKSNQSFRITIEKRNSTISSKELISTIAKNFQNKVSLKNPDWIILIEIIGEKTGVSVIKENDILSIPKMKRALID